MTLIFSHLHQWFTARINVWCKAFCWWYFLIFDYKTSKHLLVLKTCWRQLQDMSSRRLQDVLSVTIFRLPRRLEDVLEGKKLVRWRLFKTSWILVLKTSWRHVLKTSWRHVLETPWRQTKCLLGISVSNKFKGLIWRFSARVQISTWYTELKFYLV